jgi:archaellum component FlaF (FlaF/FlaG flagellin family)
MGFDGLASQAIMFIAVMSASVLLVYIFQSQVSESTGTIIQKQETLKNQLATDVSIDSITYNGTTLNIYAKNVGRTQISPNQTSIYINGEYIEDKTVKLLTDTDTQPLGVWGTSEVIQILTNITLGTGTYTLRLSTEYGTVTSEEFSA